MPGGVVVWVVQEAIVAGSETGTSSRQRLCFKALGFNLHDTIVLAKKGTRSPSPVRYGPPPELALVLSKGMPRYVNLIKDRRNLRAGEIGEFTTRSKAGRLKPIVRKVIPPWRVRSCIWEYNLGFNHTTCDRDAFQHPALMAEPTAEDFIISFSKPGDLVFDPMMGAGTTCKMALLNSRRFFGTEIHRPYYELAVKRMRVAEAEHRRRLDESWAYRPTARR